MDAFPFILLLCSFSFLQIIKCRVNTITTTQYIKDGDTIVSSDGTFELGFFSPGDTSTNRYVGIWYKKTSVTTPVWVANRLVPLTDKSGVLKVIETGVVVLVNVTNATVWSTNSSRVSVQNPVAQLLDTGNFVVRDANDPNPENFLWQSFDYPSDTLLAGMKLGTDLATGLERYLTSWRSNDDPAPGDYSYHCDPTGYPQNLMRKGPNVTFRAGPWNGIRWSGAPNMVNNSIISFGMVMDSREIYYEYEMVNKSVISTFVVKPYGKAMRVIWIGKVQGWVNYHSADADDCDTYKLCGAYGTCNMLSDPFCQCLDKFEPKHPDDWKRSDWSSGCVRRHPLNCTGDGFLMYSGVKLPDTRNSWFNETMKLDECKEFCLRNCSCTGYANLDIRNGGSGCLLWIGEMVDIRQLSASGQDIYIRMSASDIGSAGSKGKKTIILAIALPLLVALILLGLGVSLILYKQKRREDPVIEITGKLGGHRNNNDNSNQSRHEDFELPVFDLLTLTNATDNFSFANKIGEGGFGQVYKGVLEGGREVAVKRLSETSEQGLHEFKNEVNCIAKLQHRNLVKLLGCCIQGEEKMLVYEYLPNKSLELYIFDEERSKLLDWPKRFNIINGIARGLMYLHQDSRLRIIHRDLKASNVLLDTEMNPKISDFGMARSFRGDETGANTRRVVGTYGYMSPEYAVEGIFSVKSDVFSFGVLVLEIVSGKKNRRFVHPDHHLNLLGHAWMRHNEGRTLELVDPNLVDSCNISEVLRSVHVGLLCVQQNPEDRPSMSTVIMMLSNEGILPTAKHPGFFTERKVEDVDQFSWSTQAPSSINEVTITLLNAR
ncbi:G-type lectin S-receptor-like serine/threonine-protein kinase [Capsicum annuum]|uniref:G-type lectin S-receptor-like serine/threonine-protein kinase At4g27290 n=1 Tax=Capsicum annuum TaxID=4072 RepID=UPI001FB0EC57|nr:G-type lectin S-receptor-like serine/threonine-protein kinase At4g27290 [Capsicum annuum]KAF3634404.1 G-type lectin S-receptor-like serine/threonine-protein kinase [Capsicum annuum]